MLSSTNTRISFVDREPVGHDVWEGHGARYELLPGWHVVGIRLHLSTNYILFTETKRSKPIALCFRARAGRRYRTLPYVHEDTWAPDIVDEESGVSVGKACRQGPPASVSRR